MKKAVIASGGKQYLVTEGETLEIELLKTDSKALTMTPLLIIDGDNTTVGTPEISKGTVTAEVTEQDVKADKVTAIRYKAKKRVHKTRGHRQHHTLITIKKITL